MYPRARLRTVLRTGGFSLHHALGTTAHIGFVAQCGLLGCLVAVAVVAAGVLDNTLLLRGRDVGVLEHPTIWTLVALQVILPLSLRRSLVRLVHARKTLLAMAPARSSPGEVIIAPILHFVRLEGRIGRAAGAVFYSVGLAAFVWNTFQNQRPGIVLPYDFWDSVNHPYGFWFTRIYKLYLYAWFLPYLAMIHAAVLVVVLRTIRAGRLEDRLRLVPFHPDDAGGLGFVPPLVTTPVISAVLLSSMGVAAAFQVHRAMDVTPTMGLMVILGAAALAYGLPIAFLRTDIRALKRREIARLRDLEQSCYLRLLKNTEVSSIEARQRTDLLEYLEVLVGRIQSISTFPHLRRLIGYAGLAVTPSVLSVIAQLYEPISAFIGSLAQP